VGVKPSLFCDITKEPFVSLFSYYLGWGGALYVLSALFVVRELYKWEGEQEEKEEKKEEKKERRRWRPGRMEQEEEEEEAEDSQDDHRSVYPKKEVVATDSSSNSSRLLHYI